VLYRPSQRIHGDAAEYKLTAYDASYLELAIRHKVPLAASDSALTKAAKAAGVDMVQV